MCDNTVSILRALAENRKDSGPPMYGNFRGMMQVIADCFRKEIILFLRPSNAHAGRNMNYMYEVYGTQADGLTNGQILLVTDADKREHYQAVSHIDGQQLTYNPGNNYYFNTSGMRGNERYGWIDAPWMPYGPLPAGYSPVIMNFNPDLSPRFAASNAHAHYLFFEARSDAFHWSPNYAYGRYPLLPDPRSHRWVVETMDPEPVMPDDAVRYVYPFSQHQIISGVYTDVNGQECWLQWSNIKLYEAWKWQQEAIDYDIPT